MSTTIDPATGLPLMPNLVPGAPGSVVEPPAPPADDKSAADDDDGAPGVLACVQATLRTGAQLRAMLAGGNDATAAAASHFHALETLRRKLGPMASE